MAAALKTGERITKRLKETTALRARVIGDIKRPRNGEEVSHKTS